MHIGVCYIPTIPGDWEGAIATAGALGFEGIELTTRHTAGLTDPQAPPRLIETRRLEAIRHTSWMAELLDNPDRVTSLLSAARAAGVSLPSLAVTGFGPGHRLSDSDDSVRQATVERVRVIVERCAALGARTLMIPVAPPVEDERAVARWVGSIRDLLPTAERAGVKLGLETMYDSPTIRQIVEELDSPWVGDYFDVGNSAAVGRDPIAEMRLRRDLIIQVHVKGVGGAELSQGTVDLDAVNRTLHEIGFDGWVMLETPPGESPLDTARRNLATLREHMTLSRL